MKLKSLLVATALLVSSVSAFATTTTPVLVSGSFSNVLLGTISVSSLSDVKGSIDYGTGSATLFGTVFTFSPATFTGGKFGSSTFTGTTFNFKDVTVGSYNIFASGVSSSLSAIGANYTVSAVPEPKTSGMFLAGLGLIGFIASRRKSSI